MDQHGGHGCMHTTHLQQLVRAQVPQLDASVSAASGQAGAVWVEGGGGQRGGVLVRPDGSAGERWGGGSVSARAFTSQAMSCCSDACMVVALSLCSHVAQLAVCRAHAAQHGASSRPALQPAAQAAAAGDGSGRSMCSLV